LELINASLHLQDLKSSVSAKMVLLWYGRHLKKYYLQELNQSEMYLLSIRKKEKESEIKNNNIRVKN